METKVVSLEVKSNLDQTEKAVGSLKSQLRAAQNEVAALSDKFGATSREAVNAAKKAGELKDKIGDAKSLTDAFNPDAKFKALSASLTGVAGGFAAYQGALGVIGVESKDTEAALLKVQSAMALASGAQAIGESVDSFKQLGAVVKSYSIVQKISTGAQYLWNAAMAANPIGAIVAVVVALVAAGYALVEMFQASSEATRQSEMANKKLNLELQSQINIQKKNTVESDLQRDSQLKMAKASGASAKEIRKLSEELSNQEVKQKVANAETLRAIFLEARRVAGLEDATDAQKETAKVAFKALQDANKEAELSVLNRRKLAIENRVGERQDITDANKKIQDDSAAHLKDLADKSKKNRDDLAQKQKENKKIEFDKEIEERKIEGQKVIDQIANKVQDDLDEKDRKQKSLEDISAMVDGIENNNLIKTKANADAEALIAKKLADSKIQNLQRGSEMLSQISDLVGKNTAAGKAAAVAAATIDTYAAAQSAFKNAQLNPISIIGPAYPYISAGLAIAGGLKNVKSILAVKTPGGGGGSAPSGGGSQAPSAPAFNVVGTSGQNQIAQTLNREQPVVKAYVVANDVTTQQGLTRNIVQAASVG